MPLWFIVNPKQVMAGQVNDDYGQKFLIDGDAGSGPYKINRWDAQAVMALDAVADYWKGWPMPEPERPAAPPTFRRSRAAQEHAEPASAT